MKLCCASADSEPHRRPLQCQAVLLQEGNQIPAWASTGHQPTPLSPSPEKLPLKWLIPTPSGMEPERCTLNEKQLSREECVSSCIPGQQQLVLGQVLCLSLSEPQHLPLPVPADCLLPQECSVSGQGLNTPCSAPRLAGISSPRCAGSAGIASIQHKVSCCPSSQRAQAKNRK